MLILILSLMLTPLLRVHMYVARATIWSDSEVMQRQEGMLVRAKPGYEEDTALDR